MATGRAACRPTAPGERIDLLDIFRGFALLGILIVNFRGPVGALTVLIDKTTLVAIDLLAANSFYAIFSFLFGIGFAIQLSRARHSTSGAALLLLRRLAVLFCFGALHAIFVWSGDILVDYAYCGFVLLLLHRLPSRLLLLVIVVLMSVHLSEARLRADDVGTSESAVDEVRRSALVRGFRAEERLVLENKARRLGDTFAADVARRRDSLRTKLLAFATWPRLIYRNILALFLIGFLVGRHGWHSTAAANPLACRRAILIGVAGVCAAGAYRYLELSGPDELRRLGALMVDYGISLIYLGGISLLVHYKRSIEVRLRVFAPVGRMALTNYLLQSIVMTWLFLPYGGGRPYPNTALFMVFAVGFFFCIQVPISRYWLGRFRIGPTEWLWRSLVYGRIDGNRVILTRRAGPMTSSPRW
jgi:uncharacterized protein